MGVPARRFVGPHADWCSNVILDVTQAIPDLKQICMKARLAAGEQSKGSCLGVIGKSEWQYAPLNNQAWRHRCIGILLFQVTIWFGPSNSGNHRRLAAKRVPARMDRWPRRPARASAAEPAGAWR